MPLPIVRHPAEILRHVATPVSGFDDALADFAARMAEEMYAAPGVGLAANQVGDPRAIAVLDHTEDGGALRTLVNPRILERSGFVESREGCLSIPGREFLVPRAAKVLVEARDLRGRRVELQADGFLAIVLQHEIDHLEGRLILDAGRAVPTPPRGKRPRSSS